MQIGCYFTSSVASNGVSKRGAAVSAVLLLSGLRSKTFNQNKVFSKNYKIYNGNFKGH